jgi:hypothetical protein
MKEKYGCFACVLKATAFFFVFCFFVF